LTYSICHLLFLKQAPPIDYLHKRLFTAGYLIEQFGYPTSPLINYFCSPMRTSCLFILLIITLIARSQTPPLDSLQKAIQQVPPGEAHVNLLNQIAFAYSRLSLEKADQVASEALTMAEQFEYTKGMGDSYNVKAVCHAIKGEYTSALELFFQALRLREKAGDMLGAAATKNNIAGIFLFQKEYDKAIEYTLQSLKAVKELKDQFAEGNSYVALGIIYDHKQDSSKAFYYLNQGKNIFHDLNLRADEGQVWLKIANLQEEHGFHDLALNTCFKAMSLIDEKEDLFTTVELYHTMGSIYGAIGKEKTAILYFHKALRMADNYGDIDGRLATRELVSEFFEKQKRFDSALYYFKEYSAINTETFNTEKTNQIASLEKIYETEKKDQQLKLSEQKIREQYTIILTISILLAVITILGLLLFRYSREKRKSNKELVELNKDISEKNEEIRQINDNLEAEVNLRTQKIKDQNQKLIEYAFFNAHKVRGPLARVLGLVMLTEKEPSLEVMKDMHKKIHISALELDEAVKEINQKLDIEK
jgi:tetratricopeptide (TPR) repeat protein